MPRELIYTSAIQGLQPGSRGFCTVAASADLSRPQLLMLESLSAYRHEYVSGPDTRLNPVAYCHFIVPVAGQMSHVVSRIADAGLDYSRRTNMIAHHLVVSPEEMTQTDPGALVAIPNLFAEQWSQSPCSIASRPVSAPPLVPGQCTHWAEITKDAGWGGILAAAGSTRPVVLIYQPGQNILPLINESLALVSQQERWKIGFSTYYQKLPPGVVCQWKGVLNRSPEAASACALPNALVLDFTRPFPSLQPATETEAYYVDAARTGILKEKSVASKRQVIKKVPFIRREVTIPTSDEATPPLEFFTQDSSREGALSPHGGISQTPPPGVDAETMNRLAQLNSIYADMARPQKNNRQFLIRLGIGVAVALLLAAAVLFVFRQDIQNVISPAGEESPPSSTSTHTPESPVADDKGEGEKEFELPDTKTDSTSTPDEGSIPDKVKSSKETEKSSKSDKADRATRP